MNSAARHGENPCDDCFWHIFFSPPPLATVCTLTISNYSAVSGLACQSNHERERCALQHCSICVMVCHQTKQQLQELRFFLELSGCKATKYMLGMGKVASNAEDGTTGVVKEERTWAILAHDSLFGSSGSAAILVSLFYIKWLDFSLQHYFYSPSLSKACQ